MGKLIDLDELREHLHKMMEARQIDRLPRSGYAKAIQDIDGCPTVDAVPVEWIKNRLDAMLKGTTSAESCFAVQIMLADWQKEQEAR